MPTTPYGGLQVNHDEIDILSDIPLKRLSQFDMFEGKWSTKLLWLLSMYHMASRDTYYTICHEMTGKRRSIMSQERYKVES